jgi:alkylation response protein AidB-like acyl-CoA dehydrogenase
MYTPPLRDLRFVLHELLNDGVLSQCPAYADYTPDIADAVLEEAGRFASEVLEPINGAGDREGARWTRDGVVMPDAFKAAYNKFVEGGWPQLRAGPEAGGQGQPTIIGTAVEEMWASANLSFKLCPMLTQGAVEAIERCGTPEQKLRYLPQMVRGEWTGTMNLTEPQAGSDLGAIKTRATPEGDRYRLRGQKIFITYGDHDLTANTIHMVLARIDGGPPGTKGISMFIVPKWLVNADGSLGARNDVRCVSIEHKLGIHASPTCVLAYGDHEGAIGYLVGEPNRGLEYMFIMMNAARLSVGLEGYALSERAYQHALEFARNRVQGRPSGKPGSAPDKPLTIAYHGDVKRMLLTMKSCTEAARATALYAALELDLAKHHADANERAKHQTRGDLLIPIVKGCSTEAGVTLTSLGIQIHGGMGFIEETGAAQFMRDSRITPIYEGTTGIQALDLIGRKVTRDGGAAMTILIAEMQGELDELGDAPGVRECKVAAQEAVVALEQATADLLRGSAAGAEAAQAVAVPYLQLAGLAIGGWLMARAAAIAVRENASDPGFYASKRQTARFYADQVLPNASAYARIVKGGATSVVESDPALM